ncbi:hypothetical protein GPJ56_010127 [Histomonas meleagridis]|uniref:uncharacterized protein n=1 Tax=Histomonas meleagridis TaxID=135588 RepID=UPI003559D350|nr:hypothetical protein GPJ56_010127 [Histomonas meleagridis]KAH0806784.1 hypothetical protein GO595_000427 [Histomonas meleagridis]
MDKRNFMFCTDEYKHIIIDALRERRNQLHECTDEIDELVKEALPSTISGEVKEKVSALESEVYAVANEASQIGMDDDEFTDADSAFDSD